MAPVVDEPQPLLTPLQCWHESLVSARTDPLVALSRDGAFIATDRPVPAGTPLFLELSNEEEGPPAEVDAVVVAGAGPEQGFAVRFLALDDDARRFIAAHLQEDARARTPGATLLPTSVDADATSDVDLLPPPVAEPPARVPSAPVVPIELSFDEEAAAPLSVDDLSTVVPEAQTPERDDAIELSDFGMGSGEGEEMPAPDADPAMATDNRDDLEPAGEMELEPPAMAAMPSPPTTPVPEPEPVLAQQPLVVAAPVLTRGTPAPVPETDQTIKWARAPALAPLIPSSSPAQNPFSSGDSALRNPFVPREQTERFPPAPAPTAAPATVPFAPSGAPTPARPFTADDQPERIEHTERWLRPALPSAPTPASTRAPEIDQTRPWSRANLAAMLPRTPSPQPPRLRTPPVGPVLPGAELPSVSLPKAPMPRIASMDVPGSATPPAIEQTQRWPTAKVRVANAPLEMPVGDVPFAGPPDLVEHRGPEGGLDALFPSDGTLDDGAEPAFAEPAFAEPAFAEPAFAEPAFAEPLLDARLEVKPALEVPVDVVESFEPEPAEEPTLPLATPASELATRFNTNDETLPLPAAPGVRNPFILKDDTAPLPAAPAEADSFGPSGGFLGDDGDVGAGGNAADLFGGIEITDPGNDRFVPATAEDGFEAPDDIGPTLEASSPVEVSAIDEVEPLEMVEVDALEEAAPEPQVAPMFDELDAQPMITAEIPAETQERLLQAAMARPQAPSVSATNPVRTDPLFSQPTPAEKAPLEQALARPEPRPTETQPYFTLGSLGKTLPPLPPPPPTMTRPPPIPPRASPPAASPFVAPSLVSTVPAAPTGTLPQAAPPQPIPQRTDPFFPSYPGQDAPRLPAAHDPFAGLLPVAPAAAAAPLLGNAVPSATPKLPEPSMPDASSDSFFDEMAFEIAEQKQASLPTPADQWQVQAASSDDDIPVVLGNDDLPTVMGRSATPSSANPWQVGEPAKKP